MFLIPIFNILLNISFIGILEFMVSCFIPGQFLPFNHMIRTLLIYMIIIFGMYTEFGQRCVAFLQEVETPLGEKKKYYNQLWSS